MGALQGQLYVPVRAWISVVSSVTMTTLSSLIITVVYLLDPEVKTRYVDCRSEIAHIVLHKRSSAFLLSRRVNYMFDLLALKLTTAPMDPRSTF